jgi:hypothetical protein
MMPEFAREGLRVDLEKAINADVASLTALVKRTFWTSMPRRQFAADLIARIKDHRRLLAEI